MGLLERFAGKHSFTKAELETDGPVVLFWAEILVGVLSGGDGHLPHADQVIGIAREERLAIGRPGHG